MLWDTNRVKHEKINWQKEMSRASRQLRRNREAIEFTSRGTPAAWSRPDYDQPAIAPDPSAPETKVIARRLNKKQRKKNNQKFFPQQKRKSKISNENDGLPIVRKTK